jgi:hypothetical protein
MTIHEHLTPISQQRANGRQELGAGHRFDQHCGAPGATASIGDFTAVMSRQRDEDRRVLLHLQLWDDGKAFAVRERQVQEREVRPLGPGHLQGLGDRSGDRHAMPCGQEQQAPGVTGKLVVLDDQYMIAHTMNLPAEPTRHRPDGVSNSYNGDGYH